MKALTIAQPYSHLICLPDEHPRAKRVENRRWPTSYRGPLLIHAGKSREWLELDHEETRDDEYKIHLSEMTFGAIIGVADLVGCVRLGGNPRVPEWAKSAWPWLATHEHTEGPCCFVLSGCRRFSAPIPYRGAQGLFEIPDDVVAEQLEVAR